MKTITSTVESPLECTIIQRLNRFVVEIQVYGNLKRACINNTGRLNEYLFNGKRGFCTRNRHLLKTEYRLCAIREGDLGAIIDTQMQMKAFEEVLRLGLIPWLNGFEFEKRNVRLGNSVIDYLLTCDRQQLYLEVKSAVLRKEGYAMYPDCPSARGRRHIRELTNLQVAGGEAAIMFIAALPDVQAFKPNWTADPELCDLLTNARDKGANIKAMALFYNPQNFSVYLYHPELPVEL